MQDAIGTTDYSAVNWARQNGVPFQYRAALDNHEPTRSEAYGACHRYSTDTATNAFILEDREQFRDATNAVFLLDDGRIVVPYYVAGYSNNEPYLILHTFPIGVDADGATRGRYDSWMHGPRRCYHLKIQPTT